MPRYRSLDEVFQDEDPHGLLEIRTGAGRASAPADRNASAVARVNAFYEIHGRLPDENARDVEEMKLGAIWKSLGGQPSEAMRAADRNGLLGARTVFGREATPARSWRDDPPEEEVPASLEDVWEEDDEDLCEAATELRHVTPAAAREQPDHRAELYPCTDFATFEQGFRDMQAKLESGERTMSPIEDRQELPINEGDYLVHRGLLAYVAEKTELSRRGGKPDYRLRLIFSNGMESDPLMSSLRKALAADRTARKVDRARMGPLDPTWRADALEVGGTIYVARSKSDRPEIAEVRNILHKIGVTSQNVSRRVADARNDATFLLADVEIVATYELRNLSRQKVEDLLHRFFEPARPSQLTVTDRFGKRVHPREWFYVLPEHVGEAARLIQSGTLHLYRYDPTTQKIARKDE
ncbi:hypothetical protein CKO28_04960 [Rhodovibrio sodomensis]|uniref:Bacteriophage T5 Orf172 DNA-binding domain-containing protein n=1 Tax=Rhodovibrio sodomensis TaxID=1088 RepID=A0ABS1DAB1_9PROT|nr:GIY-YIG nuclease family protein [Rhodovibrio sodomensis]MBK1667378.1 hypothetical protein [Rhodovibrio sodomensis]